MIFFQLETFIKIGENPIETGKTKYVPCMDGTFYITGSTTVHARKS